MRERDYRAVKAAMEKMPVPRRLVTSLLKKRGGMLGRHLSVWRAAIISIICIAIILFGLLITFMSASQGKETGITQGLGISAIGFSIGILNKFVFRVRRTQLGVDRDEAVRDGMSRTIIKQQKRNKKKYLAIIIVIVLILLILWIYGYSLGAEIK